MMFYGFNEGKHLWTTWRPDVYPSMRRVYNIDFPLNQLLESLFDDDLIIWIYLNKISMVISSAK